MKDIILRIIGNQRTGFAASETEGEAMEFITEGRFTQKGDSLYLIYDETELSGIDGCTTSLKVTGERVRMRRYGEDVGFETAIEFEQGKRFSGYYETPFGPIAMEVLTNVVNNQLDPGGTGTLDIDCSISLKGLTESRNILKFEII
ncbi:MAG: DUF1934 domain-containing protein [Clostridiales Family XIII bacterium]|jgi:uncharacterized beta-barrel protein YwiB (DUF1934 family)|nr:DUF1934 domain-containing protein [Clostridiales Family XIII bacterium]